MDNVKYTILYPNILPPEVLNSLVLILIGFLIFWLTTFVLRCFHLFEGIWSYRNRESYLIKVSGLNEISSFWSNEPTREYLLSFLREKLDSPMIKIPNIRCGIVVKDSSLKVDVREMFGREHSYGIRFEFFSEVHCKVELFWQVKEILFNEQILEVAKNRIEETEEEQENEEEFNLSEIMNKEGFCLTKTEQIEFEPDEENVYTTPEKLKILVKDETTDAKFKNEPATFFTSIPKEKKKKPHKKSTKHIQVKLFEEKEIILPLVILISKLHNREEELPEKYDGEVQNIIIIAEFKIDKKIQIVDKLYFTKKGMYSLKPIYKDEGEECVICLSEDKEVTFIPCCHNCVCKKCLKHIEKCPICRNSIDGFVFD